MIMSVTEPPDLDLALVHNQGHVDLARQVLHNLRYQHLWKELVIHTHSSQSPQVALSRPLISGLPPSRLYVHPDEQIELLEEAKRKSKLPSCGDIQPKGGLLENTQPEREWILPARLDEKWSLQKLAKVFDNISLEPPDLGAECKATGSAPEGTVAMRTNHSWHRNKRVLLGIVDSDSTVVYYVVHDGIVKPRQN